jgi:3-deoxy-manno-octulosonate cytidylyltransferase (CMP-KDO synthetase)
MMTRHDHPSGTDRVAEAVEGLDAEVVINIQGDEPLIDPGLIDRLADAMLQNPQWDMATAASPILSEADLKNPSVVKVVWGEKHQALYFSRSVIPFVRDNDLGEGPRVHWRHLGIYAYRKTFLNTLVRTAPCLLERAEKLEQLRALSVGARMAVLEVGEAGIGVDTPEDVPYVEKAIGGRQGNRA